MSEAHLGKIVSNETHKRMSEAHTGIPLSEEHRRRVSEGQRGKVLSEENRRKISETQKRETPLRRRCNHDAQSRDSIAQSAGLMLPD